ncbi:hypothetical protein [Rhizobium sp. SG2393]|uniref:hypothetical protein n=1 Tax=Rhizobium sp. SG2393 TaxID=3276279 RepID=UPI00366D0C18
MTTNRTPFATRALLAAGLAALTGLAGAPAFASSDDAWAAMRKDVAAACRKLAAGSIEKPVVTVDPFGSQSYGLALLQGKPKGGKGQIAMICVYDKKTRAAEIGGELTDAVLTGKTGKKAP